MCNIHSQDKSNFPFLFLKFFKEIPCIRKDETFDIAHTLTSNNIGTAFHANVSLTSSLCFSRGL